MTTFLWIGLTSTEEIFESLAKKGYSHAAAFVAQRNIITGIEKYTQSPVHSINGFMMPHFPKRCSELITSQMKWEHIKDAEDESVLSVNLPYIDFAVRKILMPKSGKKWANAHKNDNHIEIIVYTASEPYIRTALAVKKIIPNAKITLIVPDLPLYMELKGSKVKQFIKTLMWGGLHKLILKCDRFVLFTKHMAEYLDILDRPWIVMEGSVNTSEDASHQTSLNNETSKNDKKICMYSGAIGLGYGVPELLDAIKLIDDPNYEFWFTGRGNADFLLENASREDRRIKVYGFLPSRNDVLKLQEQAMMLINTRKPTEKASSYCFPSKIFEYMQTGKPVLSFRIPGIPDEYYEYLVEMKEVTPCCIRDAIIKTGRLTDDQRLEIGNKGREFVRTNKNNFVQAKRIVDFISDN